MTLNVKDLVWCPAIGLEGEIQRIEGNQAQVWWADDDVSWESLRALEPLAKGEERI